MIYIDKMENLSEELKSPSSRFLAEIFTDVKSYLDAFFANYEDSINIAIPAEMASAYVIAGGKMDTLIQRVWILDGNRIIPMKE